MPRTLQGYQVGLVVVIVTFCQNCCNSPLTHLLLCTLFAPQNFAEALFSIFLGTAVIPTSKEKQRLCKNFGKQIRYIMEDVQVVNITKNAVVFGRKIV